MFLFITLGKTTTNKRLLKAVQGLPSQHPIPARMALPDKFDDFAENFKGFYASAAFSLIINQRPSSVASEYSVCFSHVFAHRENLGMGMSSVAQ